MPEDTKEQRQEYIKGLLREREGAERRAGNEDEGAAEQVKLIDAELKRMGYEAKAPAKRAETRPVRSDTTEKR